jgi:hypothetical protein
MTAPTPGTTAAVSQPVAPYVATPAAPAAAGQAAPAAHSARRRRSGPSLLGSGTPSVLLLLLTGLVIGSIVWGVIAEIAVGQHSSAANEVVSTSEPLSLDAQRMYQSLADADVTATTSFLAYPPTSSKQEPLSVRLRLDSDLANAGADLALLRGAAGAASSSQLTSNLAAISAGLPVFEGYVRQATTWSLLGYPSTGGSLIQDASEEMHLILLPAANAIYQSENAALTSTSAQATGLPLIVVAVLLAIAIGYVLLRAQRWLTRRTNRRINPGLLLASAAVVISTIWLVVAFAAARSDFGTGLGHGSTPAGELAQADIAAQEGRADQVLNLISRSGSTSFQQLFAGAKAKIGPGSGTFLAAAQAAQPAGAGASDVVSAEQDAKTWYTASSRVFTLDVAANYAAETQAVIGTGTGSSVADFAKLERDVRRAIAADQVVFQSNAASGSAAFGGLEAGVIIAALLMASGSAWGLSRRLAEYR